MKVQLQFSKVRFSLDELQPSVTMVFKIHSYCDLMNMSQTLLSPIGTVGNLRDSISLLYSHSNLYASLSQSLSYCLISDLLVYAFSVESLRHRDHVFFFLEPPSLPRTLIKKYLMNI